MSPKSDAIILISANAEWAALRQIMKVKKCHTTPYGEWFVFIHEDREYIIMQGGWGKMAAAGSAQYAIDRWNPRLIVNLGTCGGFYGQVNRGEIILAKQTFVYDIIEQMGNPEQAILDRAVELDLSWIKAVRPKNILLRNMVSADRDILPEDIPMLRKKYNAVAADWESGSIAWVAYLNNTRCLIMRGVTDLVGEDGGEVYGNYQAYVEATQSVMKELVRLIGWWN